MHNGITSRCIAATYDYHDESGALLYQVVRYEPKAFRQRRPDGRGGWIYNLDGIRRVLYRLQELLRADPQEQAVKNAMAALESKALFDGPEESVAVRLAERDGMVWLDLADEQWRAVKVTVDGWEVVTNAPVRFLRPRGMLALPEPAGGG